MINIGIGMAFVAMLCWGFGDFLIQKSTRKLGDFETLFLITFFGSVVLLPFTYSNIINVLAGNELKILVVASIVILVAALFEFQALKIGKISVVEPIWSMEIPASVLMAFFVLKERLEFAQIILIVLLIVGLLLVSFKESRFSFKFFLEKGVYISFLSAILMGVANFFVGWGGRITDPLMINFFINTFVAIFTGLFLIVKGNFIGAFKDFWKERKTVLPMVITDNSAWIAFAYAMMLAPIGVVVALSESYIIIAVALGLVINKEKLQHHQKIGLVFAFFAAIILAYITT